MTGATPDLLRAHNLDVSVPGRELVRGLDLELRCGEVLAILGPNGVGKSLTLQTMAGLRQPQGGTITYGTDSLAAMSRRAIAERLALLPQQAEDVFPATALDTVLIGRHPHVGRFQWESRDDRRIAREAMADVGLAGFETREIASLSGGERRRLAIAQVLTQRPATFLLDEPTNHLDPQHQLDVLRLFQNRATTGAAVATSLHDVNLAARFADRCLLLYGDGRWAIGDTAAVLSTAALSELYGTPMEAVCWHDRQLYVAVPATIHPHNE